MARGKYHRFRNGERCDDCGARQWYAQDAIRYCRNGHRLEGFAEHEADEDAFGTQGKVSRKKKEPKKKIAVKLSGDEGRELYLEILQLVLMKQVRWLVREKGFPEDFEEIIRALWALRVRNLPLKESGETLRSRRRGGGEGSDGYASSDPLFSSQSEGMQSEPSDFDLSDATTATTATWAPDAGRRWKLPKPVNTLALCYLGCLVRRLPATTADFCGWAQRGEIDFLAALNGIPRKARDRLPAEYHRALQIRDHIPPGRLQAAVQELVISYKVNFDIVFPPLNYIPIVARFITDLTLPIEIYLIVKYIAEILKVDYTYHTGGKKIRTMDNPEVLLISLVVVSAKLLYPLDGIDRPPRSHEDPRSLKVDWAKWQQAMHDNTTETSSLRRGEEYKVTTEDVLTMDKTKLDDFMDWFEKMWIRDDDLNTSERIREAFEGQKRPSSPSRQYEQLNEDREHECIRDKYEALNSSLKITDPVPDPKDEDGRAGKQPRDLCPVWRTQEDLPDAARALYSKAADLTAIPLNTLVRGVVQVERRLEVWCTQRAKQQREEGKGKAVWTGDNSE
ncbi:hypothetical protein F5Y05DRAFT_369724 [Hypoxylon sp. FL0543]|nr:hypothetical protein F5Y05DRAFT_369724 [Hypoxylon sp. FL0543]